MVRAVVVLLAVLAALASGPAARADAPLETAVALLPLDAPDRLAIYGQPVAATLATALRDAGVDVDVVGPGVPVPTRARLVIDGWLRRDGDAVLVELRLRDPRRGVQVGALRAVAAQLTAIDGAVRQLQGDLVPLVRGLLEPAPAPVSAPAPVVPVVPSRPPVPSLPVTISGIASGAATALGERLAYYLAATRRGPRVAEPSAWQLDLEIRDVAGATLDGVPVARARLRARLRRGGVVVVDRVARTDTVVGARTAAPRALVDALARQLVDIIVPLVRRPLAEGS